MRNINIEIFKRYKPVNKIAIVESLTKEELLGIHKETLLRILHEVGKPDKPRGRFRFMGFTRPVSNDWNSTVNAMTGGPNKSVYFEVYIQGSDTDTTVSCNSDRILARPYIEQLCGEFTEELRGGRKHLVQAFYNGEIRSRIIREVLITYIVKKYGRIHSNEDS